MRTQINLSRRPFTNHRLLWIGLVAAYFLAFWLLLWMSSEKSRVIAKQNDVLMQIANNRAAADKANEDAEKRKREQQKVVISEQQAMQLASARQLIQRKMFSWNRMVSDIEEYVPKNTRILSIKVQEISKNSDEVTARIQVKALGTTTDELTTMMTNLEKSSGLFVVGDTGQDPTTENGETPFTLDLTYKPRGEGR